MNIGFASPVSLQFLRDLVKDGEQMPPGYQFAPAADWVKELLKRGHRVTVYTTARGLTEPATFSGDRLTIRVAPQRSKHTGRDLFAVERRHLTGMMREDHCEVIHAHWTYQFALAALASRVPTLVTIHDLPWKVFRHFHDPHRAARLLMAYQVAFRGSHFTAVSTDVANHFRRYFHPRGKITVIPNGLPDSMFEESTCPSRADSSGIVFATILQGWSKQKNAAVALRAFALVRRSIPNAQLFMYGTDYQEGGPAQQWATKNNLYLGVRFVGPVPYDQLLKRINSEIDIVVHPSLNEAFSMTVLEMMALKKPIIAGISTPGMRDMLACDTCGILANVHNPRIIARYMHLLATNSQLRHQLKTNAFNRAWSHYRLRNVIDQYESLYRLKAGI